VAKAPRRSAFDCASVEETRPSLFASIELNSTAAFAPAAGAGEAFGLGVPAGDGGLAFWATA
jgi:hypothetical protein